MKNKMSYEMPKGKMTKAPMSKKAHEKGESKAMKKKEMKRGGKS
jgi:hypothetical protein